MGKLVEISVFSSYANFETYWIDVIFNSIVFSILLFCHQEKNFHKNSIIFEIPLWYECIQLLGLAVNSLFYQSSSDLFDRVEMPQRKLTAPC